MLGDLQGVLYWRQEETKYQIAYKDIHNVMAGQTDLVEVIVKVSTEMVRMADDESREHL